IRSLDGEVNGVILSGEITASSVGAPAPGRAAEGGSAHTRISTLAPHHHPILHHESYLLHHRDVREGIAGDGDEVGELSRLDGADAIAHVEQLRGRARPGDDGL